jgi:hypothetical protein
MACAMPLPFLAVGREPSGIALQIKPKTFKTTHRTACAVPLPFFETRYVNHYSKAIPTRRSG